MDDGKGFETILQRCLERLEMGESVQACLRDFPEHAEALAPLLAAADQLRWCTLPPLSESTYAAVRARTLAAFARRPAHVPPRRPAWGWTGWWPRAVALASVLLLIFAGAGITGAAAQQSLPGSLLYSLKRGTEQVRLELAQSPQAQASLYLDFAGRRLDEALAIAASGRAPDHWLVDELGEDYDHAWQTVTHLPLAQQAPLLNRYTSVVREHCESLQKALAGTVAPATRSGLEPALSVSEQAAAWPTSLQPRSALPAAPHATTRSLPLPATSQPSLPVSPTPTTAQGPAFVQLLGPTAPGQAVVQQPAANVDRRQASPTRRDGTLDLKLAATVVPKHTVQPTPTAAGRPRSQTAKVPQGKMQKTARPPSTHRARQLKPAATATPQQTPLPTPTTATPIRPHGAVNLKPAATATPQQTPPPTPTATARLQATAAPHLEMKKKARRTPRQAPPVASPTPTPAPAQGSPLAPTWINEQGPDDEQSAEPANLPPPDSPDTPFTDPMPAYPPRVKPGKGLQGKPVWSEAAAASRTETGLPEFAQPLPEEPTKTGVPGKHGRPFIAPVPPDFLDTNAAPRLTALLSIAPRGSPAAGRKAARIRAQGSSRAQKLKLKRTPRP